MDSFKKNLRLGNSLSQNVQTKRLKITSYPPIYIQMDRYDYNMFSIPYCDDYNVFSIYQNVSTVNLNVIVILYTFYSTVLYRKNTNIFSVETFKKSWHSILIQEFGMLIKVKGIFLAYNWNTSIHQWNVNRHCFKKGKHHKYIYHASRDTWGV